MLLVGRYRQETTRDERIGLIIRPPADECRLLPVILAVRDFLALFEHVFFGLVVGNFFWRRGLLAILGVMVGVLVVGVLVLGVAVGAGWHGCESCLPVPGTQPSSPRRCRPCPALARQGRVDG